MCLNKNNANENLLHSLVKHDKSGKLLKISIQQLMTCVSSLEVANLFKAKKDSYGTNVLICVVNCVELTSIKILLEFADKIFHEDFSSSLNETDEVVNTFLRDLWTIIKNFCSQDQLKSIIIRSNRSNENVLHNVSKNSKNTGMFKELLS